MATAFCVTLNKRSQSIKRGLEGGEEYGKTLR